MTARGHVIKTHPGSIDVGIDADGWRVLGLQIGERVVIETGSGDMCRVANA